MLGCRETSEMLQNGAYSSKVRKGKKMLAICKLLILLWSR